MNSYKSRNEDWEKPESLESNPAKRISLGGNVGGSEVSKRNSSYLHAAPLFLIMHDVHGCLASHFLSTE